MDQILEHLQGKCGYNKKGEEIPDPTPTQLEINLEAEMPLELKVMRAIQSEGWARHMENKGLETFDEANDFDIPEEESEYRTLHEDEMGDVIAYEEGVRRGFIEEIPEDKKIEAKKTAEAIRNYGRNTQTKASKDTGTGTEAEKGGTK